MSEPDKRWKKVEIKRYATVEKRRFEILIVLDIDLERSFHLGYIKAIKEITKNE